MFAPLGRIFSYWFGKMRTVGWLAVLLALLTYSARGICGDALVGHLPPGDAPHVNSDNPNIPVLPPGFHNHDGGWIQFHYPPESRSRIQKLLDDADRVRSQLSERLGRFVLSDVNVRIARTSREMMSLAPVGVPYPKYASGVAYPDLNLVLLTLTPESPNERLDIAETFRHELAHLALSQAVNGQAIPRWFNEGFAIFASGESSIPRLQTLWTATLAGTLVPLERLERSFPEDAMTASIAYAEAADVVRYLARKEDHHRFNGLIERMGQGQNFSAALLEAYGLDRFALEYEWREDVGRRYTFWPVICSTGVVWGGIMVLFFVGFRRRRSRDRVTLERWKREEAQEDLQSLSHMNAATGAPSGRVHIVVARPQQQMAAMTRAASEADREVPRVEHEGHWHTLH
jgi:hypothetical protein